MPDAKPPASFAEAAAPTAGDPAPPVVIELSPRHAIRRLAVFQSTVLGLIIGTSCLLLLSLVLRYTQGGFTPRPQANAVPPSAQEPAAQYFAPGSGEIYYDPEPPRPSNSTASSQTGKSVRVLKGAKGDMIRWRFQVEDEDDRITQLFTGKAGAAYILSDSENLCGRRLDVVSAAGRIIDSNTTTNLHYLLGVGSDGAVFQRESRRMRQPPQPDALVAKNAHGRQLWLAQLPHSFDETLAVGGDGTVFAVGVTQQRNVVNENNEYVDQAQSCISALSPGGRLRWSYERAGALYWPLPLEDGGVLAWNCPRYDKSFSRQGSGFSHSADPHRQPLTLLCLDRNGRLKWTYDVGYVRTSNASAANGKLCVQQVAAGEVNSQQLVLLNLDTGRELARFPAGPLSAPPLMLPDGAVVFQNEANVLIKLSPKLDVLWAKALHNPLRHAPLIGADHALCFCEAGALQCLEADGSERFSIPTGGTSLGLGAMQGPDGLIYVATTREVLAFRPD